MQRAKETAADVAASAKAGTEKTKATLQEKAEKMTTSDQAKREMAEREKEVKFYEAEREKEEMRLSARRGDDYRHTDTAGDRRRPAGYSVEGPGREDYPTGVTRGVVGLQEYTAGLNAGSGRTSFLDPDRDPDGARDRPDEDMPGVQDPRVAGGARTGHGSGSTY